MNQTNHFNRTYKLCCGDGCKRRDTCLFHLAFVEAMQNGENPNFSNNLCELRGDETYIETHVGKGLDSPANRKLLLSNIPNVEIAALFKIKTGYVRRMRWEILQRRDAQPMWSPKSMAAKSLICWCDYTGFPLAKICKRWQWDIKDVRHWLDNLKHFEYMSYIKPML